MQQRISNPKRNKEISYDDMQKFFAKEQSHSRVIRRFSQRSQSIMNSITLEGMKMDKRYLQFLPQIGRQPFQGRLSKAKQSHKFNRKLY